jgi:AraC-like DNA-binding protein
MLTESRYSSTSLVKPGIDVFGCPMSKLGKNQELRGTGIKFFSKGSDDPHLGQIATDGDDRGFLIGVSQTCGHRRRIFQENRVTSHDFDRNSVYIRNLANPYRADLEGSFDFLLMELSRSFLREMAEEHSWRNSGELTPSFGCSDPVLSSLLRATQPALEKADSSNLIFVDQLGIAISIYLFERYGGSAPASLPRGRALLSRPQMTLTSEMLRSHADGNISIAELAAACGLSRGYFIHAFKSTTGATPHQWILSQRVERARDLLKNSDLALAEVALICGFADQSHFTRVFSRMAGTPPGNWRRSVRN